MLSSNSSCNQEPILNYTPFPENDITSSFFPNSPHTHLEYQHFYLQYFHDLIYHHHSTTAVQETTPADSSENVVVKDHTAARNPCCKNGKASSKKDRHSKINTARGPRDRRMRLSLDIARKFFDLQDLLGYDKASRTVDWLLRNSGPAIKELARAQNPCSDQSSTCGEECNEGASSVVPSKSSRARREKVRRVPGRATVGRESRRKARERARERTSQKRRLKNLCTEETNGCEESLGLISSFKESHVAPLYDDMQQLQCSAPWNPSTVFNYQEGNGVFLNDHQDEQTAEFQFNGKTWEAFNSFDLSG